MPVDTIYAVVLKYPFSWLNNELKKIMANKENKILDELRRNGKIFEDPCPKSESIIGKLIDIFSKRK